MKLTIEIDSEELNEDQRGALQFLMTPSIKRPEHPSPQLLNTTIYQLEMSERSNNALIKEGIKTIGDLISHTAYQIKKIKNIGHRSFNEIWIALEAYDLALKSPTTKR